MTELQNHVHIERGQLLDGKESIKEAVLGRPNRAQDVAVGLLSLGDVAEAKAWFQALAEEWVIIANSRWDSSYQKDPRQSAGMGPWSDYIDALYCAILGRDDTTTPARTVLTNSTESFVDELENRDRTHRIDLARALSSHLLENEMVEQHLTALEDAVEERDKPWAIARYLPYARVLRGLDAGDVSDVEAGIQGLLEFHRDHVASARDADAVQKAVALDATAMLALARREGMAITVDDELIPGAVNDDEYYPIEG
ncbi:MULTISPECIES: Imm49 family immunity protein [Haloarcula]|jgi:hypothetical protein|uniref:Imm49 family immunity protein n=1 Tax=Haloarcula TaxID=2237 RepID=UPI0013DE9FF5|nr:MULTISPECIES: Imm49 family immunity protein [Haloarcula]NHX41541.1 hypothetical protein [Haloarcula sp. R1-2]